MYLTLKVGLGGSAGANLCHGAGRLIVRPRRVNYSLKQFEQL
jgi:hypothetical protein